MARNEFFELKINHGTISVFGDLRLNSFPALTAAIHNVTVKSRYPDVTLDLSNMTSITCSVVAPLAAHLRYQLRDRKVDFDYIEPNDRNLAARLIKLGLSHYIDPQKYEKPKFKSSDAAVIQFLDHDEREFAIDKVLNAALRTASMQRAHLAALEWAVNEITDNVLTHANSGVGGFLICHTLPDRKIIEFTVADAGIGVARSLGIPDDETAVQQAIKEGVTRNKSTNQGNGLYGSFRIAVESSGVFVLKSGRANLYVTPDGLVRIQKDFVPYRGTFVVCQIDYSDLSLVERALSFAGKPPHVPPFDYIERKHEGDDGVLTIHANEISKTIGSRVSGLEARRYISNILRSDPTGRLEISFEGLTVISSSYADEVFGKLFVEMGPIAFMKTVKLVNANSTIETLINRAITLRSQTGL